jgi:hypothetical protein
MAVFAVTLIAFSSPGFAAKGGDPGPPVGGETSNNLSLPSIQTQASDSESAKWFVPNPAALGTHYSYGCDKPESNEQFNYPNTSCVDDLSNPTVYYTAEQCTAPAGPCAGLSVSRIYWQKVDVNDWWADDEGTDIWTQDLRPVAAKFVDWGDALEAVPWNERSVIRVETQPYSSTLMDAPGTDGELLPYEASLAVDPDTGQVTEGCTDAAQDRGDPALSDHCKTGFQMWHVSGQGITEHWGVRATDAENAVPYTYESPFQIIKSTQARLNLTKMEDQDAVCLKPGPDIPADDPPERNQWIWNNDAEGTGYWVDTCTYYDAPYSVETSVGGKYVYGYNWRMKLVDLSGICPGWLKTGFWRLTFYSPDDIKFEIDPAIFELVNEAGTPVYIVNKAPPAVPAVPYDPTEQPVVPVLLESAKLDVIASEESDEEDPDADDRLFRPVIDNDNDLTYIDICIVAKTKGGGGGKGGGKGAGVGGGTGGGKGGGDGAGGGGPKGGGH